MEVQHRHVLVVDDDADIREMITLVLEMDGSVVTSIASGHDAITYLHGCRDLPDLMVLDLDLGDMTGEELMVALCQHDDWCNIPIVLMSGSSRLAQTAGLLSVPVYVPKPFDPIALQAVVKQHARPTRASPDVAREV
ncbi:MAG: response regulator [Chloroflexota bacterium]|nr:response regulator [Chloroflexota bacterium]